MALFFQASLSYSVSPIGTSLLRPAVFVRRLWTSQSALCPSVTSLFGLCLSLGCKKKGAPVRTTGLCPAQRRCNVTVPTANLPFWIDAELEDRLEVSCINDVTCLLTHSHTHYGIVCVSTGALCSITVLWSPFHSLAVWQLGATTGSFFSCQHRRLPIKYLGPDGVCNVILLFMLLLGLCSLKGRLHLCPFWSF